MRSREQRTMSSAIQKTTWHTFGLAALFALFATHFHEEAARAQGITERERLAIESIRTLGGKIEFPSEKPGMPAGPEPGGTAESRQAMISLAGCKEPDKLLSFVKQVP